MTTPLALVLALPLALTPQDNPAKDLKSKDWEIRKAAVLALTENPTDDAEKLLAKALKDEDWEIAELAAIGLGSLGESVGKTGTKALLGMALDGPIFRLRREAARSLAKINADEAIAELSKKLSGKQAGAASDAIVELGAPAEARSAPKSLKKAAQKGKEYETRRSAAMALLIVGAKDRTENLTKLLEHEEVGVHAAALDSVRVAPEATDIEVIATFLTRKDLPGVNERRGLWGLRAALWGMDESDRESKATELVSGFLGADADVVRRRGPVLLEYLLAPPQGTYGEYTHGKDEKFSREWVFEALAAALEHDSPAVRAAAVHALGAIATEDSLERAREIGSGDSDAHVRRTALAAAITTPVDAEEPDEDDEKRKLVYDEATADWLIERIDKENDPRTREDLCVALGTKNFEAALEPLTKALTDSDPWVAVCAAVSLGKTRLPGSIDPLRGLLSHEDWRIRGAAVIGLGQSFQKDAIEHLILSVDDAEPSISRAAHDFLKAYSKQPNREQTKAAWMEWWEEKKKSISLIDPETADERAKKYGYSTNWDQIYGGLDIVVLDSRGDHIQHILEKLGVQHRLTQAAQIPESSLHPQAVYVSNCTGEIESPDVDHLAWFLRTGGYLFGSCWSLHETIEKVYPGVVRKYETVGEVLDLVSADNCAQGSDYLEGVFAQGVQPLYSLEGAHLIEVMDPERAQVLIDSPQCAENWGAGDLAVWFPAGHGVVLDSVNHFEEQGFTKATGLKKPEQLQAYAVDHLGLNYSDLRATRDEKYWKSPSKAAGEVLDLSVFKLITNFVRIKRLRGR